jgi:hypothetical protein
MRKLHNGDFELGAWYNPLSWFSSEPTFTKEQNVAAGERWLREVYNLAKPNYSFFDMIERLKTSNFGDRLTDEDYKDFLDSIGFAVHTNKKISDRVRDSLATAMKNSPSKFPDRRQISSAFLNPDNVRWTLLDAIKVTASQGADTVAKVGSDIATVAKIGVGTVSTVFALRWWIVGAAVLGGGYFLYLNRKEVAARLRTRTLDKFIGPETKANPKKKKKKYRKNK